jgi:beta-glucosidase
MHRCGCWYDARRLPVRFPFGHGLSYTTFAYRDAAASTTTIDPEQGVTVRVTVSNTGERAGSEVVQVYARDTAESHVRPEKALCGFAKVRLEPGESRTVEVEVDARAFSSWDPPTHRWVRRRAAFDLLVARSVDDVVATLSVSVSGEQARPSRLTDMSPLRDWLEDEAARDLASEALRDIAPILGATFGEWPEDGTGPAMHFDDYFGAMPLRGVLEFAAASGGPDPDAKLTHLLDRLAAPPEDTRSDQPRPVETVPTSGT